MLIDLKSEKVPHYINFLNKMYSSLRRAHKENDLPDKSYLERLPENEKNSSIAVSKALLKDYDTFVQNSDELSLGVLREGYGMFTGIF